MPVAPLQEDFLKGFCPDGKKELRDSILAKFGGHYADSTDKEIYISILPFFIDCENKKRNSDALRKWIDEKVVEIIELLNGRPPERAYTRETLRILFEKYDQQVNLQEN